MIVPATLASIAIHCVHAHTRCMKMLSVRTLPLVRTFAILAISPKARRSEEHTSELQSQSNLVCRLLLEKKKKRTLSITTVKPGHQHFKDAGRRTGTETLSTSIASTTATRYRERRTRPLQRAQCHTQAAV